MALIILCNAWALFFVLMTSFSHADIEGRTAIMKYLEQNDKAIESLQAALAAQGKDIAAVKDKLTAASTGVAFTVRFSTDNANAGLPLKSGQILQFDDVVTNTGNGYDRGTGIFTAPKSGDYAFFLNVMGIGAHGHLAIKKNDKVLTYVYSKASLDPSDQGTTMVTSYLAAGDKVWVSHHDLNAIRGGSYTIFTGFLTQSY